MLTTLSVPRFSHGLLGSITDRRDYYHQARVTRQRSQSNLSREAVGDDLAGIAAGIKRKKAGGGVPGPQMLYAGFSSLFQGDHLGVEFALQSHEQLLAGENLLDEKNRLRGHHLPPWGPNYEALIIDDYFAIGAHPISQSNVNSFAALALAQARTAYDKYKLEGSVEKDVEAADVFKAAGAEVVSRTEDVRRGCVCVGAPVRKRLALSALSLRAATLPGITAGLASRLSGNWVSALLFRRCLSSIVDDFFAIGSAGEKVLENTILPLGRAAAEELQLLAITSPWMVSNVAAGFSKTIYASDASLASGAYVSCDVGMQMSKTLWLSSDRKGYYTRLDGPAKSMLAAVGEEPADDVYEELEELPQVESPFRPPLFYFDFVEICGGSGVLSQQAADLGLVVAPVLDLSESEHYNLCDVDFLSWIFHMFTSRRFRSTLLAPPCTTFSAAAWPDLRSYQNPLGYCRTHARTLLGNVLAFRSFAIMFVCALVQAPAGLEQPRLSKMAWLTCWRFLLMKGFEESVVASCQFGSPHKKEFRILSHLLSHAHLEVKCPGGHQHVPIQGKFTKPSAIYVPGVARHIAFERGASTSRSWIRLGTRATLGLSLWSSTTSCARQIGCRGGSFIGGGKATSMFWSSPRPFPCLKIIAELSLTPDLLDALILGYLLARSPKAEALRLCCSLSANVLVPFKSLVEPIRVGSLVLQGLTLPMILPAQGQYDHLSATPFWTWFFSIYGSSLGFGCGGLMLIGSDFCFCLLSSSHLMDFPWILLYPIHHTLCFGFSLDLSLLRLLCSSAHHALPRLLLASLEGVMEKVDL